MLNSNNDNPEQIEEALGSDNMWLAGNALGHSPSKKEAIDHYIKHGGAERFRKRKSEEEKEPGQ